ncbi:MAG TPA: toprim domain-containing protein, partial [Candidatus Paceibacterota bacterium]|nr:toprim domain-containing protein [Candidatus Paceibacterota bacterium]
WSFVILVEGQMDLVMSHQAGYKNAVALSGTALTDEHVDQILRLTDRLVLALDTDKAGIAAAGRSATLALRRGLDVKVALLSEGKDPADLIALNPELWKEAVRKAVHIVDYYLKIVLEKEADERKRRLAVSATVLPYIALIAKPMDRAHFVARAAQAVHLPEEAVRQEVEALRGAPAALAPAVARAEEALRPHQEVLVQTLYSILWWLEGHAEGAAEAADLRSRLLALAPETAGLGEDENLKNKLVFQAELLYAQVADLPQVINDLLLRLEREKLRHTIDTLRFELTESERAGSAERTAALLEESRATARKLSEIDARLQS